jgi:hypothetical protein
MTETIHLRHPAIAEGDDLAHDTDHAFFDSHPHLSVYIRDQCEGEWLSQQAMAITPPCIGHVDRALSRAEDHPYTFVASIDRVMAVLVGKPFDGLKTHLRMRMPCQAPVEPWEYEHFLAIGAEAASRFARAVLDGTLKGVSRKPKPKGFG